MSEVCRSDKVFLSISRQLDGRYWELGEKDEKLGPLLKRQQERREALFKKDDELAQISERIEERSRLLCGEETIKSLHRQRSNRIEELYMGDKAP